MLDTTIQIRPVDVSFSYDFRLRGTGNATDIIILSVEDAFCMDTLTIQTVDCTPIICDADFVVEIDDLELMIQDNSITSDTIIDQSWIINDIIQIGNIASFNFTVDSIGSYNICHTITTDSCSASICKDVFVGDPCDSIIPMFSIIELDGGFQFQNESMGEIDEFIYNFGDNTVSNSPDPFHIFDESGTFEICLTVRQEEFSCQNIFCDSLNVVITSTTDIFIPEVVVYPNPIDQGKFLQINIKNLEIDLLKDIYCIDLSGKRIAPLSFTTLFANQYQIDTEKIQSGMYFLIIETDKGRLNRKVFIR